MIFRFKKKTGKNLIPSFSSGRFIIDSHAVANGYTLTLNAVSNGNSSYVLISVTPNTDYIVSCTKASGGYHGVFNYDATTNIAGYTTASSLAFNSGNNSKIRIYFNNYTLGAGIFTFVNPMLTVSTANQTFSPYTVSRKQVF